MKKIFFSLFLFFTTTFCFSQWTWQNPLPQGNNLSSVFFIDSIRGYIVGDYGTILRTVDGGVTWLTSFTGTTRKLYSVHFSDINIGYAVGYAGTILKTTDSGVTWTLLKKVTEYSLNSVYFRDSLVKCTSKVSEEIILELLLPLLCSLDSSANS